MSVINIDIKDLVIQKKLSIVNKHSLITSLLLSLTINQHAQAIKISFHHELSFVTWTALTINYFDVKTAITWMSNCRKKKCCSCDSYLYIYQDKRSTWIRTNRTTFSHNTNYHIDHIIYLWAHKTGLTTPLFTGVPLWSQEIEHSCLWVWSYRFCLLLLLSDLIFKLFWLW